MGVRNNSFLAILFSCTLFATPGWAEIGVTNKEVLVGTAHVLSGQSAEVGKETGIGINTCINEVNARGGVFGRKIKIVSCDDKYEPDAAITCFVTLRDEGVFALLGVCGSATSARYIPMATINKMPIVGFYNGTSFVANPAKRYIFSTRCSYHDEMKESIDQLWKHGFRRFGVIYQHDAFGADCLEGVKEALKVHGAEIVSAAQYTRNKTDVGEAVNEVRKSNPEVVFLGAAYKPCAEIVKLAKETNWSPYFVLNSGASVERFIIEAGENSESGKIIFTEAAPVPTTAAIPLVETYLNSLKTYYPQEKPNYLSLRGYIDAVVFVQGLKHAGKELTRENFIDALEHINHSDLGLGKGMELSYSSGNHLGFNKVFFGTIRGGRPIVFNEWAKLVRQ